MDINSVGTSELCYLSSTKVLPFASKGLSLYKTKISSFNLILENMFRCRKFEIRPISRRYFNILVEQYPKTYLGDVYSCGLLNMRSMALLGVGDKCWIKVTSLKNEIGESSSRKLSQVKWPNWKSIMPQVPLSVQEDEEDELEVLSHRTVQCLLVDNVPDFVIYTTSELYINMQKSLLDKHILPYYVNAREAFPYMTTPLHYPEIAVAATVSIISSSFDCPFEDVNEILQVYFDKPRYLVKGDVFSVSLEEVAYPLTCSVSYYNVPYIYFMVTELIYPKTDHINDSKSHNKGCFVIKDHTHLYSFNTVQSYLPPILTKCVTLSDKSNVEFNTCPAGLDKYYRELYDILHLYIVMDESCSLGLPKVLLSGTRGSGKNTTVECVVKSLGLHVVKLDCFDLYTQAANFIEAKLNQVFTRSLKTAPCVLLLLNVELLGRDKEDAEDIRTITAFITQVTRIQEDSNRKYPIFIVGHTNKKLDSILPHVARLFVKNIEFKPPTETETEDMLDWFVKTNRLQCNINVFKQVSKRTSGYVFGDLMLLIRQAVYYCHQSNVDHSQLTVEHFNKAIDNMESSYSDAIGAPKIPNVYWDDVGGLSELKEEIKNTINFPLKYPELAKSGLRRSGILLYGPPGTGKTLIAKAVATEFGLHFLSVKGPELMNMYVGQSEQNVREVFSRARDASPCIIFFDELDSLAPNRGRSGDSGGVSDRVVSQLLAEMDGLQKNVNIFIIAATNRPDLVDPALLRPGRFDKMLYVGACSDVKSKLGVFTALTRKFKLDEDVNLTTLCKTLPDQVTGADLYSVCSNAWMSAARRCIQLIEQGIEVDVPITVYDADFKLALKQLKPSVKPEDLAYYQQLKSLER